MELQKLKLVDVVASPTNPREDFDKVELAGLSEDIKLRGLLQPILVRKKGKGYEIIAGERRFRAHQLAEIETIDAIVVEMTDLEAEEAQLAENEKRDNLKPLEKANGYAGIMKRHGLTVDQLAEKLKKSRSNIYATVRLLKLHPDAKAALKSGTLKESHAKLLAQVHSSQAAKATKEVLAGRYNGAGPMSYREAVDHLESNYFLNLKEALFDPADAELDKAAGACTSCEKRTGANPELPFDGVKLEPDRCTDQPCHAKKTQLAAAALAEKKGLVLMNEKEVKALFNEWGDLQHGAAYVRGDRQHPGSSADQTYAQLLTPAQKKELGALALVHTRRGSDLIELYANDGLTKAIEETGKLKKRKAASSSSSSRSSAPAPKKLTPEEQAKADFDKKVQEKLGAAVRAALITAVEKAGPTKAVLGFIARRALDRTEYALELRGVKGFGIDEKTFKKHFGNFSPAQLVGLLMDASLDEELGELDYNGDSEDLVEVAKTFGVDVKKVEAAVRMATPLPKAVHPMGLPPIAAKKPVKAKAKKAAKPAKKKAA